MMRICGPRRRRHPAHRGRDGARGYFIVEGGSFAEMIALVNHVFSRIEVLDWQGQDLLMRYEDYPDRYRFYPDR